MDATTFEVEVDRSISGQLRDLLESKQSAGVAFAQSNGFVFARFTITAPTELLPALRAEYERWRSDCASSEAW